LFGTHPAPSTFDTTMERDSMKIFGVLTAIIFASAVAADDTDTRPDSGTVEHYKSAFSQLDKDEDSKLTVEEAEAGGLTADNFRRLDEDGNGYLNREEFIVLANDPSVLKGFHPDAPYGSDSDESHGDASSEQNQHQHHSR